MNNIRRIIHRIVVTKYTETIENHKKTAVFGGLSSMTLEQAKKWLTNQVWSAWLSQLVEIYCKGEFKGIIFAKFQGNTERDEVVGWFRKTCTKIQDADVWSKPDCPLNERILQSLVFGTKSICCKKLWADAETGLVTL